MATVDAPKEQRFVLRNINWARYRSFADSVADMVIYAALRVPEAWRFDGEGLHIYDLGADGKYVEVERSRYFPFLPMAAVLGFLQRRTQMDETSLVRSFRRWVREQIASGWQADQ